MLLAKGPFDVVSRAVAAADPQSLRRCSLQKAELMGIGVFRDKIASPCSWQAHLLQLSGRNWYESLLGWNLMPKLPC